MSRWCHFVWVLFHSNVRACGAWQGHIGLLWHGVTSSLQDDQSYRGCSGGLVGRRKIKDMMQRIERCDTHHACYAGIIVFGIKLSLSLSSTHFYIVFLPASFHLDGALLQQQRLIYRLSLHTEGGAPSHPSHPLPSIHTPHPSLHQPTTNQGTQSQPVCLLSDKKEQRKERKEGGGK